MECASKSFKHENRKFLDSLSGNLLQNLTSVVTLLIGWVAWLLKYCLCVTDQNSYLPSVDNSDVVQALCPSLPLMVRMLAVPHFKIFFLKYPVIQDKLNYNMVWMLCNYLMVFQSPIFRDQDSPPVFHCCLFQVVNFIKNKMISFLFWLSFPFPFFF